MARKHPPDRLILAVDERRGAILDVIRKARRNLVLSLFRCNDEAIFNELTYAVDRGVAVEVITTSRAKGGRGKLEKLRDALDATGATVRTYNDPVVKYHAKYIVADDGPAVVASLNFTRKCFRKTLDGIVITHDPVLVVGFAPADGRRCGRNEDADRSERPAGHRSGARAPAVHGADRAGENEHSRHRRQTLGSRARARCCVRAARAGLRLRCSTAGGSAI